MCFRSGSRRVSWKNSACTSRVYSHNHILGCRQRGQNAVTDFLDRLTTSLATATPSSGESVLVAWRLSSYLPGDRPEPPKDAEHVAN